jgi:hypothetical protein
MMSVLVVRRLTVNMQIVNIICVFSTIRKEVAGKLGSYNAIIYSKAFKVGGSLAP